MCTTSWRVYPNGDYELFFNRDEQRSWTSALPVQEQVSEGARFLAPIDAVSGGTWLAATEYGLTFGLLNWYGLSTTMSPLDRLSRGLIIPTLCPAPSIDDAESRLRSIGLERHEPFHLLMLAPGQPARLWGWDGRHLKREALARRMWTSSSHDTERVIAWREMLFDGFGEETSSSEGLLRFQNWHEPAAHAESIRMVRSDARTVSRTRVVYSDGSLTMDYTEIPEDLIAPAQSKAAALRLQAPIPA